MDREIKQKITELADALLAETASLVDDLKSVKLTDDRLFRAFNEVEHHYERLKELIDSIE